jgi:hypothetical protein
VSCVSIERILRRVAYFCGAKQYSTEQQFEVFWLATIKLSYLLPLFHKISFIDIKHGTVRHLYIITFRITWGSSVSIISDNRPVARGSIPGRGKGFFLSPLHPDQLWGPLSPLSNGQQRSSPGGKGRPGRDADHSPHLVPM